MGISSRTHPHTRSPHTSTPYGYAMRRHAPTEYAQRVHAPTAHPVDSVYPLSALCRYPQAESAVGCQPSLPGRQDPVGFQMLYQLGMRRQQRKQTD